MKCPNCGTIAPEAATVCRACESELQTIAAAFETVAMAAAAPLGARPASVSSPSRLSSSSIVDEGRFLPGTLIAGRYRVISLLGRGGMGEVYRATDLTLGQSVALKFLPEAAASNERLLERFHNEVRVARQVSHPNVCRVYDIGEADGYPFISMEYVDGEDLASLLSRIGRLPADKALDISRRLCAGVAAAHERGIIHRDLKPHNIMLNKRGEVVIMDFGLAAVADELRGAEARNGTPAYMAPEQLRGDSATARSDIYALGLIIYELFTGKRVWEANSIPELIAAQESARPSSITTVVSDADPAIERVILRCLAPDPAQRPQTALSVAAALPGGDPLAAALAAGETPSPELVAASGKTKGIALRWAAPCLAIVLLGVLVYPLAWWKVSILAARPIDHPPEVLATKAREIASALGYTDKPRDWTGWYYDNIDYSRWLRNRPGRKDWSRFYQAETPYRYFYRESPQWLASPPDGELNDDRPPMIEPGMVRVKLDTTGKLRQFEAIAPRFTKPGAASAEPDFAAVFRLAGFDIGKFSETEPVYSPPQAFDLRRAWTGTHPDMPDMKITLELAFWRGKLTSFFIIWPWTSMDGAPPSPATPQQRAFGLFALLSTGIGLCFVIWLTRRNIRHNRGDRRGAMRLAVAGVLLSVAGWLFRMHFMPNDDVIAHMFQQLSWSVFYGTMLWLLYMALEPAIRARWPHSLITWNRVLAGQWRDARVGSHVLIGATIATAMIYMLLWGTWWSVEAGGMMRGTNLAPLRGTRYLLSALATTLSQALSSGCMIFFVLCGLRQLIRYDWLTALVASVLLSFQEGGIRMSTNLWVDFPLYIGIYGAIAFALLRLGLLTAIATLAVVNTLGRIPIVSDPSQWYTGTAAVLMMIVAGVAIYAFLRSQSGTESS
jgi:serine/threonine-protein kinase